MSAETAPRVTGVEVLRAFKSLAGHPGPPACLLVGRPPKALLRPVATHAGRLDPDDVRSLTEWRNRFVSSFLTEFVATEAQTGRWLTDVVGPDNTKMLFMADSPGGCTFGYLGLAFIDWNRGCGEADAIVRGGAAEPGVMSEALKTLLAWARFGLGLSELGVRVRSDNPAIAFYRKLGFEECFRCPLRRTESSDKITWVEDPALDGAGPSLVHLRWPQQPKLTSK
jgi:RimJ/RimL family protein N-acetyltransferase